MNRRDLLLLFALGLIIPLIVAYFQPYPGYLDADYYFAGGLQLAQGKGFTEPYLWNYLDDPQTLPHPSHAYWMPLASLLTALGMWLTGQTTYASGRLLFLLIAALIPPLTATLAFTFSHRRALALTSGLLAVFPVFHLPFMPVPDNFGTFMLLGGLYFLLFPHEDTPPWRFALLGLLAGFFTLARNDGLLWLALTLLVALWFARQQASLGRQLSSFVTFSLFTLIGFLLVMAPWYARNFSIYGSPMPPGTSRTLWLTRYDETFIYPPTQLTPQHLLVSGWAAILKVRLWALNQNIQSGFAAHGAIILFPFIVVGAWGYRSDRRVRLAVLAWLILFFVMTVIFPFAGARGAFFHAGAALQPLWWSLAPLGLEIAVAAARQRGWFTPQAFLIFRIVLVQIVIILSIYVCWMRLFKLGWGEGEQYYPAIEQRLQTLGIQPGEPVMVLNPPAYYLTTGRSAIVQPYGEPQIILTVAQRFGVRFFVFESSGKLPPVSPLYENPQAFDHFRYLGEVDGARIFQIQPAP